MVFVYSYKWLLQLLISSFQVNLVDHTHDDYITWLTTPTTITLPGWPHPRRLHYLVIHIHNYYITWLTTRTTITLPGWPHPQLLHYLVLHIHNYYITWLTTRTTITLPGWPHPRLLHYLVDHNHDYYKGLHGNIRRKTENLHLPWISWFCGYHLHIATLTIKLAYCYFY
jgi:hypothetical protein